MVLAGIYMIAEQKGLPTLMTLAELADYLRVHRSTIYRLLRSGKLQGFKFNKRGWRFNKAAIDRWRRELECQHETG